MEALAGSQNCAGAGASTKDSVRLALNMPVSTGAGRVIRRFPSSTTFEELYAFVECYELVKDGPVSDEKAGEAGGLRAQVLLPDIVGHAPGDVRAKRDGNRRREAWQRRQPDS